MKRFSMKNDFSASLTNLLIVAITTSLMCTKLLVVNLYSGYAEVLQKSSDSWFVKANGSILSRGSAQKSLRTLITYL